jgi:thiamine monophosphate kinase
VPLLREFASSCIDTSDGVLESFDILARLNNCGIEFRNQPSFYATPVRSLALRYGIPLWLFAAAEHGEFELLFSVPPGREREFLARCAESHLECSRVGTALGEPEFRIATSDSAVEIDIRKVRGLAETLMQDPGEYVSSLIEYSSSVGIKE